MWGGNPFTGTWTPRPPDNPTVRQLTHISYEPASSGEGLSFVDPDGVVFETGFDGTERPGMRDHSWRIAARRDSVREISVRITQDARPIRTEQLTLSENGDELFRRISDHSPDGKPNFSGYIYTRDGTPPRSFESIYGNWVWKGGIGLLSTSAEPLTVTEDGRGLRVSSRSQVLLLQANGKAQEVVGHRTPASHGQKPSEQKLRLLTREFSPNRIVVDFSFAQKGYATITFELAPDIKTMTVKVHNLQQERSDLYLYDRQP